MRLTWLSSRLLCSSARPQIRIISTTASRIPKRLLTIFKSGVLGILRVLASSCSRSPLGSWIVMWLRPTIPLGTFIALPSVFMIGIPLMTPLDAASLLTGAMPLLFFEVTPAFRPRWVSSMDATVEKMSLVVLAVALLL